MWRERKITFSEVTKGRIPLKLANRFCRCELCASIKYIVGGEAVVRFKFVDGSGRVVSVMVNIEGCYCCCMVMTCVGVVMRLYASVLKLM